MGYWKELPYRGEPPDKPPRTKPPKRIRTPKDKWRDNIKSVFIIILFLAFFFCLIYFDPHRPPEQNLKIILLVFLTFLLMIGFGVGVDALNKRLRGDDLDNPKHIYEEESDKE